RVARRRRRRPGHHLDPRPERGAHLREGDQGRAQRAVAVAGGRAVDRARDARNRALIVPGIPPGRYAYLGPRGTFCEAALRTMPGADRLDPMPCGSVSDALDAVRAGEAAGAVVPLENSVEGSVAETLDELATGDPLQIVREVLLDVSFALMARAGTALGDISTVTTMPHAEAQVRGWLR